MHTTILARATDEFEKSQKMLHFKKNRKNLL